MSKYMAFLDTETSGFIKKVPADDPTQNVACEIAVALVNTETRRVEQLISCIIKTDAPIPQFLVDQVHGISNELSHAVGHELDSVLPAILRICEVADWNIVCHNTKFDKEVMSVMIQRSNFAFMVHDWNQANFYCTMESSTNIVQCPPTAAMLKAGRQSFKAPKLEEAYQFFYREPMGEAHRAWIDVQRTIDVYFAIQDFNEGKWEFPKPVYSFPADEASGD